MAQTRTLMGYIKRVVRTSMAVQGRKTYADRCAPSPFDHDSGRVQGRRSILGGPAHSRRVLYMAALSAIRWEPSSQACYQRLGAAGKEHKRAMVTVMRKRACLLTALLREDRCW